ncbi:MAG: bifunctional phosphoribosyl-AMP cyclohydrolase/phosphoribosyl-ATP diphosphatase HisIE [Campylobacterales bacterium]
MKPDFDKATLLPAIVQDHKSLEVLMVAFMDKEAYELTLSSGYAHYFSRSKNRIWKKGEESGNVQRVEEIRLDCDSDAILLKVQQKGVACHTGRMSCFFNNVTTNKIDGEVLEDMSSKYSAFDELFHIIEQRKNESSAKSYTALLFEKGENSILKKVCEEAGELCFAIKDKNRDEVIAEGADLIYHISVALSYSGVSIKEIENKIRSRFGVSGLEEKRQRGGEG